MGSHGYLIFGIDGIHSNARSNAPVALAGQQRHQRRQASSTQISSANKFPMEEAIEAAKKRISKVLGGDSSDGEVSQDEPPIISLSASLNEDECSDEIPLEIPAFTSFLPTDNQEDSTRASPSLVGQMLPSDLLVTDQLRVGSTKSELFKCYHTSDEAKVHPFVIKISHNTRQIELEHKIYRHLSSQLTDDQQGLFCRAFEFVDASPMTDGRTGFVMECGIENLRGFIWKHGAYTGEKLKNAMRDVIRIVHTLHSLGTIWTEVKAENLIVFGEGEIIKAIDLESFARPNEFLRAYTAETYPPEFPADMLYEGIPEIPLDYSFDVYGLGLVLFELATGEPLFTLQRTYDVDYIKERLRSPQGIVEEANLKLENVDPEARKIILRCLVVDPEMRSTCDELLKDDYFQ